MLIYHINEDKEVTFKRSNRDIPEHETGVYGILKCLFNLMCCVSYKSHTSKINLFYEKIINDVTIN